MWEYAILFLRETFSQHPFVPSDEAARAHICDEILTIQAMGLEKRLSHTNAKSVVVGISGGLDSTLALLVTAKAFDMLGRDEKRDYCGYDAVLWDNRPHI